ncbi:glycoside hydrolase family 16 protein [Derxia gummosa]|uniref:Glycoside hydrolase family 16 protein n=1 Tax=Derxia gummosa DSM 723 TaxID=1121388 RepID=A0A8B6X8D3_9BURK|nr:glycoside hydrolase family 16 protein [Derxia gummosa]
MQPTFPRVAALALSILLAACSDGGKPKATALPYRLNNIPAPQLKGPAPADIPATLDLAIAPGVPAPGPGDDAHAALVRPKGAPEDVGPIPELCIAVPAARATETVHLKLAHAEPFDTLRIDDEHWAPHYEAGHDTVTKRWFGYDGLDKRRLDTGEEQIYVDRDFRGTGATPLGIDPFVLKDGQLSIVADRVRPEHKSALGNASFTSGLLASYKFFSLHYGYVELRARMPVGQALWPAFWLLPTDRRWPPELDVFEVAGQKPELIKFNLQWSDAEGRWLRAPCQTRVLDAGQTFHDYGLLWTEQSVTWFIDRKPIATAPTPASMRTPMYVLINLAVGSRGSAGKPDATTPAPAAFVIDHFAAWSLDGAQ